MRNLIILGAGASYGCSWAREEFRPPLLKNLFSIVMRAHELYKDPDPDIVRDFEDLYTSLSISDFEVFCTALYYIEKMRCVIEPKYVFFTEEELHTLLENTEIIDKFIPDFEYARLARKILSFSIDHAKLALEYIAYRNFQTLFTSDLRNYIYACHRGHIHCNYHEKLFRNLDEGDVVVSFNYDEIADYTLLDMGKLAPASFDSLGFSGINIPSHLTGEAPVKLIKLHGSFNWYSDFKTQGRTDEKIYYNLPVAGSTISFQGGTPTRVIFPLKHKEDLYKANTVLSLHQSLFYNSLCHVESVWLVGKTFMNNDYELARRIKESCTSKKVLNIIDPSISNPDFIQFHLNLFNANLGKCWNTIKDYYENTCD